MIHASQFIPAHLISQAAQLARISELLRSALPPELKTHVWFGGVKEKTACLLTDNGCWVTTLRFQQRALLELINSIPGSSPCERISIKVMPEGFSPTI